jgi:hypothetical protein
MSVILNPFSPRSAFRILPIVSFSLIILCSPIFLRGQGTSFSFDWSSRPKTTGQTVNAPQLSLTSTEQVTFRITNINDIFYNYKMNCTATAKEGADLSPILGLRFPGEAAPSPCDVSAQMVLTQVETYLNTPAECGINCTSISVGDTKQQISKFVQQINNALKCDGLKEPLKNQLTETLQKLSDYLMLDHIVTFQNPVSPDQNYTCTVTEYYMQQPTTDGSLIISVQPTNALITLSLGPVFSKLQNRSYSAVVAPNAGSSGTSTVLGVQGNSISSGIAALVNVRVPIPHFDGPKWGVDLAAGPVVRLNSQSGTSSAGFFAGISLRLYRYIFVTPGSHVGEFADFPQGFSGPGQPIPPNFGTPQPRIRTSARFGIAITFQVKDFSSVGKSTVAATNPPPVPAGGQPQANAKPSQQQPQQQNPVSASPSPLDFGTLGDTAISKPLTITNSGATAVKLSFDLQDPTKQLDPPNTSGCESLQASGTSGTCTLMITLKPGTKPPSNVVLNIVPTPGMPLHVDITWKNGGSR